MKKTYLWLAIMALSFVGLQAQTDLEIALSNYDVNEVTTADTLHLDFEVLNNGPQAYSAGDTLYFSARLNGMFFGLDLLGTETAVVLTQNLGVGQSFTHASGYLVGSQTLFFFPGYDTLQICVYAWGKGIASVNLTPAFPGDTDSTNNVACVTYNPAAHDDLSIAYSNYADGEITAADTLRYAFEVTNEGRTTFKTGDTVYVSMRLNGQYFALDLLGTETPVVLTQNLGRAQSFAYDPGYLVGSQTLAFFPGATTLESCLTLWGRGIAAVDLAPAFPVDDDSTDNVTCMLYDPTFVAVETPVINAVYPNPASDLLHFELEAARVERIEVYNLAGQWQATFPVTASQMEVRVGTLPNGIYLLTFVGQSGDHQHMKISVQH
jgi:Secretion system C-terminal sorting domain